MAQIVKRLPTMRESRVQSLGWEDLLEKEMATHSSILAWKIPWTEKPGRLQPVGLQRVRHDWATYDLRLIALVSTKHQESAIGLPMSPPRWTSLSPPSPAHPLSCYPALNFLSHVANSHWLLFYIYPYIFQCVSLKYKDLKKYHY